MSSHRREWPLRRNLRSILLLFVVLIATAAPNCPNPMPNACNNPNANIGPPQNVAVGCEGCKFQVVSDCQCQVLPNSGPGAWNVQCQRAITWAENCQNRLVCAPNVVQNGVSNVAGNQANAIADAMSWNFCN
jgi:hypothetical protein